MFSPFVRSQALQRLHEALADSVDLSVVMRWDGRCFAHGACDPEVYRYCQQNGIQLKKHQRIHLKLFAVDDSELVAGSANLTDRGLGVQEANVEFMCGGLAISGRDRELFMTLERDSKAVTAEDYAMALRMYQQPAKGMGREPELPLSSDCLLSDIPTVQSPQSLWRAYARGQRGQAQEPDEIELLLRLHVPPLLDEVAFVRILQIEFFRLPLLACLTDRLRREDLYFGALKQWLLVNCSDAVRLGARDVTGHADRLLNWIEGLGSPRYEVTRPHHSERIRYDTDLPSEPVLSAPGERSTKEL